MAGQNSVRLLLVGSSVAVRASLEQFIRQLQLPYVLETAESPQEAVRRLHNQEFDAALLDCSNGKVSEQLGTAIKRLWAEEELRKVRHELESRVERRTAQLKATNRKLQQEIAQRKTAEEEAQRRLDELAHVERFSMMGEMVSGLAHELNQPLAAIANYAQVCRHQIDALSGAGRDGALDSAAQVAAQADRAGQIIRRLRNFVRRAESRREAADLGEMVREVVAMSEVEARLHNVHLELDLEEPLPLLKVDRIQIEQVIANLVRNAIEATLEEPRESREVTVRTSRGAAGELQVAVADTGRGLRPEEVERLFEPFYTTKREGMGLGLSISRSIVRSHGGHLQATANRGQGTTFSFTLPIQTTGDEHE